MQVNASESLSFLLVEQLHYKRSRLPSTAYIQTTHIQLFHHWNLLLQIELNMPSISKMAATSLALTTVLFMPGAFGAAIQSEGLERCDFDSESTLSPSPASDAAKRQSNADLDTALENIFGRPSADGDQKPSQDSLESIFGKPPAGSEQQTSLDILGSVSGKPPAGDDEQELSPEYLESIFGKPPPTPQGADANVPESNGQTPAPNDDGRVLSVGVYMHIVGKPGNNESVEFFLSVCCAKPTCIKVHLLRH